MAAQTGTISVFIVEDHAMVRRMLGKLITQSPGLRLCGEAASAEAALEQIPASGSQLVLVDVSLPGMDGIQLIALLKQHYPDLLTLAVSGHEENMYALPALRAGARGYVMKGKILNIADAIHYVCNGGIYASAEVQARLTGPA